mmetsp:Transcript_34268/g.37034  ORF Transcript_34268/g.37034 Transcript_34268/m.37034 type:complete len:423 (-) Transcript_34268:63-1331(-)
MTMKNYDMNSTVIGNCNRNDNDDNGDGNCRDGKSQSHDEHIDVDEENNTDTDRGQRLLLSTTTTANSNRRTSAASSLLSSFVSLFTSFQSIVLLMISLLVLSSSTFSSSTTTTRRKKPSSSSSLLSSLSSSWFSSIFLCFLFLGTSSFCFISKTRAFCHHSHHSPLLHPLHQKRPLVVANTPTTNRYSPIIQTQQTQQQHQQQQQQGDKNHFSSSGTSSASSALYYGRPDWMRRFGRIEEKRKERVMIYTALRKRQKELGIVQVGDHKNRVAEKMMQNTQPQRYRVVSPSDILHNSKSINNSTTYNDHNHDDDDLLKVYIFVPENDWDANDESNVLERLNHGDIITSINKEITSSKTTTTNSKSSASKTKTTSTPSTIDPNFVVDVTWIEHDRGGWSPSIVNGITRLIPIDDDHHTNNDAFQ